MRSVTSSPITDFHAVMPKSARLSVVVAEKPTVRRNGGIGWRLAALRVTSRTISRVTPRRLRSPCTFACVASTGSMRVETKRASGCASASSNDFASVALFQSASPRSMRAIGTRTSTRACVQSSGSNTTVPVLPDTVPSAWEKPACEIANITRVCTGSSRYSRARRARRPVRAAAPAGRGCAPAGGGGSIRAWGRILGAGP